MKSKFVIAVFLIVAMLIISGCESLNDPNIIDPTGVQIKTQTKWLTDTETGAKIRIVGVTQFQPDGRTSESIQYFENGNISNLSLFEYENNLGIENKKLYSETGELLRLDKIEHTFDKSGNLLQRKTYDSEGQPTHILELNYNNSGQVIKRSEMDLNNNTLKELEFMYDFNNQGNVVKRIINDLTESSVVKDSLVYKNQNTVEVFQINDSGNINTVTKYQYNQFGKIIMETLNDSNGNVVRRCVYEYEYFN